MSTPAETSQDNLQTAAPVTDPESAPATDTESADEASRASGTDTVGTELTDAGSATGTTDEQVSEDAQAPEGQEAPEGQTPADGGLRRRPSRKVAELEREGEIAADFLETLLDIADLDGDLEVDVEGDRAAVAIVDSEDGAAPQRLVGKEAAVLEALQELTRLAVQAETGERSRLMLDVAGHRAARRAALIEQARKVAHEVKESGKRQELEAMSAFERKVVHDEVLASGLTSESEGEEPNRYVVVLPAV